MTRKFLNTDPIDDKFIVLDLLYVRHGSFATKFIDRRWNDVGPYVDVVYHSDFSNDVYRRFKITDRVIDELLVSTLINGTPRWGYTDMKQLVISSYGVTHLWNARSAVGMSANLYAEHWFR